MKKVFLLFFCSTGFLILFSAFYYISRLSPKAGRPMVSTSIPDKIAERLTTHAAEAKQYVSNQQFNNSVCLLIDMSVESGKNRFFLYDLSKDSVLDKGLVTHGRCNEVWLTGRKYGNEFGCGCTSLGKYKVGHAYKGKFGLAYKLTGLESSNNNAFKRYVVLHAHECVPDQEAHPFPICQSDGCPTVSNAFLKKLSGIIDGSSRPILLWIYD